MVTIKSDDGQFMGSEFLADGQAIPRVCSAIIKGSIDAPWTATIEIVLPRLMIDAVTELHTEINGKRYKLVELKDGE
jgi:hypothetical protein